MKRPFLALAVILAASPVFALVAPIRVPAGVLQASLTESLVAAVERGQASAIAAGLSPADAQTAIEDVVRTVIATNGATPEAALEAILGTRTRLHCPAVENLQAADPPSCPRWVNAALAVVEKQINDAADVSGAPAATGGPAGYLSLPAPPTSGASGGGGAGYRPGA